MRVVWRNGAGCVTGILGDPGVRVRSEREALSQPGRSKAPKNRRILHGLIRRGPLHGVVKRRESKGVGRHGSAPCREVDGKLPRRWRRQDQGPCRAGGTHLRPSQRTSRSSQLDVPLRAANSSGGNRFGTARTSAFSITRALRPGVLPPAQHQAVWPRQVSLAGMPRGPGDVTRLHCRSRTVISGVSPVRGMPQWICTRSSTEYHFRA